MKRILLLVLFLSIASSSLANDYYVTSDGGFPNVGIGTTNPSTTLNVNGAVKIEDNTLLATPQSGTFEFDNDRMYLTNIGTQRAVDRTSDVILTSVGAIDTTTETTLWTGTIGANDLKVGNLLKVMGHGQISSVSAADVCTLRIYVGSTEIVSLASPGKSLADDCWAISLELIVRSLGASGVLARYGEVKIEDSSNNVCGTTSVDTTTSEDITITAQWNNAKAGNTIGIGIGYMEFKN